MCLYKREEFKIGAVDTYENTTHTYRICCVTIRKQNIYIYGIFIITSAIIFSTWRIQEKPKTRRGYAMAPAHFRAIGHEGGRVQLVRTLFAWPSAFTHERVTCPQHLKARRYAGLTAGLSQLYARYPSAKRRGKRGNLGVQGPWRRGGDNWWRALGDLTSYFHHLDTIFVGLPVGVGHVLDGGAAEVVGGAQCGCHVNFFLLFFCKKPKGCGVSIATGGEGTDGPTSAARVQIPNGAALRLYNCQ